MLLKNVQLDVLGNSVYLRSGTDLKVFQKALNDAMQELEKCT